MIVRKITTGYVAQIFDTETGLFTHQAFYADTSSEYETEEGCRLRAEISKKLDEEYLPYDMVQPENHA